jgi:hypothetical protein
MPGSSKLGLEDGYPRSYGRFQPLSSAARQRLHEIVILRMKTWLPAETLNRLREAEAWRRGEVRLHFKLLERFREEQR